MKRLILTLALAVLCLTAAAQEHISFAGIPVDGALTEFVARMKDAGFTEFGSNDTGALLKGKLFGRDCTVIVKATPKSGVVYAVNASFPIRSNWKVCKGDYLDVQSILNKEYGRPVKIEKFERPYREGDGLELHHLNMGLCKWISTYNTPSGPVTLRILPVIVNNGQVMVSWEDSVNLNLLSSETVQ